MTQTREDKVAAFRTAGGKKNYDEAPEDVEMIFECIFEEMDEFCLAAEAYKETPNKETREQLCKEWADLQYVVSQAAAYYDILADEAFDRVHNSNMTKVIDGKVVYRDDGKILKPETYVAPDMKGL